MNRLSRFAGTLQEGSLYVLLFLLPFSKAAVEICFGFLLLGWVMERWDVRTRSDSVWRKVHLRPIALAVSVYLGICALSITVSDYPALSVRGFVGKWLEYLLFFVIATDLGARRMVVRRSAFVIAWSSVLVVIEAVTQEVFGKGIFRGISKAIYARMGGPYENPIDLATYLMVVILILLTYASIQRHVSRWLLLGVVVLLVVCLGRTMALGVWIAFGIAVVAVLILGSAAVRHNTLMLSAILALSAGYFLHLTGQTHQILSFSGVGTADRVVMWQAATNMIRNRPILGHGVNTFMANYLAYWVGGERQPRYAHNCYLQVAAETGVIGLAAFLWLLWGLLSRVRAALQPPLLEDGILLSGMYAGLLAFVVHAGVDTDFYSLRQAALFWVVAGLAVGLSERASREHLKLPAGLREMNAA